MTLGFLVQHYITQKLEADRRDCQDALAFSSTKRSFTVTDGATEAYGSRYWARLLAKSWIRFLSRADKAAFLDLSAYLGDRAHQRWNAKSHSWYAEEKMRAGSFAAFIGFTVELRETYIYWQALSVGDCCLIQSRDGKIIAALPLSDPSEFTNRPVLLPSLRSLQNSATDYVHIYEGSADIGDVFLLMSDAVACWFLNASKLQGDLVREFERLLKEGRTEELDIFIDDRRAMAEMKDDDVAVIYVKVVG
jgi:Protein phosphatase 2C